MLRHAHSTCVCVSETTVFQLFLHSGLRPSVQVFDAIAHTPALSCSPPTPTGFSGNLYFRHKGASGSLLTALSKLTRRSTSPLTPTLRRRVSPDSVLTFLVSELERIKKEAIYQPRVLFIRNLGFITPTAVRQISFEETLRFEKIHEETYRDFGFELVSVEPGTLAERVSVIEAAIR